MIVFIFIWSICPLSEILLNLLTRSGKKDKKGQDKETLRIIWITISIAMAAGSIVHAYSPAPIINSMIIPYIGLGLIVFGMVFRFSAIWSLGKMFTVDVTIRENHKIKKDGLYKILRHPAYSGMILSFIGFGFSVNNWISLLIVAIPVISVMIFRIKTEEKMLLKQFGDEYSNYMKATYRLLPWIF